MCIPAVTRTNTMCNIRMHLCALFWQLLLHTFSTQISQYC